MNSTALILQEDALTAVRQEFGLAGKNICLASGEGIARILVSAAIAAPGKLVPLVEDLRKAYPALIDDFRHSPLKQVSLVGGLITERPLLMPDVEFTSQWRRSGLKHAMQSARINPVFREHIHLLVRIQVAYCELYELDCRQEAPARHFEHVKPLRYILHAT